MQNRARTGLCDSHYINIANLQKVLVYLMDVVMSEKCPNEVKKVSKRMVP